MSSSADIGLRVSISMVGGPFLGAIVEVFAYTFGHAGAVVSALRRSSSSAAEVLLSFSACLALKSVMQKPGPFNEVSKAPE